MAWWLTSESTSWPSVPRFGIPSPFVSTQYGPWMPTNAITLRAPIVSVKISVLCRPRTSPGIVIPSWSSTSAGFPRSPPTSGTVMTGPFSK